MAKKTENKAEDKFSIFVQKFCKGFDKDERKLRGTAAGTYASAVISLLRSAKIDTVKTVIEQVKVIEKGYNKLKNDKLADIKLETKRIQAEILTTREMYQSAKKSPGVSPVTLNTFKTQYETKRTEFLDAKNEVIVYNITDQIFKKASQFLNSKKGIKTPGGNGKELMIQDLVNSSKSSKRKSTMKNGALGMVSAITGSILPSMIPEGIDNIKQWKKDFKANSKMGKAKAIGGLALKAVGFMSGSALPLMGASFLKESANADLQKRKDADKTLKDLNASIFRQEYNSERDKKRGISTTSNRRNRASSNSGLSALLRALDPTGTDPKFDPVRRSLNGRSLNGHKHGGSFLTTGPTRIGNGDIAGESGPETIKIIPKGQDPVENELKKTNSLIQQLLDSNLKLEDFEEDKSRLAGLANKDSKKEKSLFDPKAKVEQKTDPAKAHDGIMTDILAADSLKFMALKAGSTIMTMLPTIVAVAIPAIGALIAGGIFTAGIFGIKKLLDDSGWNKKTEEEGTKRVNAQIAADKANGITGDSKRADQRSYFGISQDQADANTAQFDGYAKGGSFQTNGPHKMVVGEKDRENVTVTPIDKPLGVVIKDDESKLGREQLSSLRKNDKLKTEKSLERNKSDLVQSGSGVEATKPEDTSLMGKISSMVGGAGSAISSGVSAAGEAVSSGWDATKSAVGGAASAVGKGFSAVKDSIFGASKASGVDAGTMTKFAQVESGFKSNAKAGTSSATGLYQFTKDTWQDMLAKHGKQYGLDKNADPNDPKANSLMAAEFIKDNQKALKSAGIPATDGALYLMHFLGPGATKLLKSNRNKSAASIFPQAARSNHDVFFNKDGSEKSVADIIGWADKKMNIDVSKIYGDNVPPQNTASAVAVPSSNLVAQNDSVPTKSAKVKPKQMKEGSVKNIKNNSAQGSEGSELKNKEVATDISNDINKSRGTEKAISNISVANNSSSSSPVNVNISTGDNISYPIRLAKSY